MRQSLNQNTAKAVSYAGSAKTFGGRAFIRLMENASGRPKLLKRAAGYDQDFLKGRVFWDVIADRYGLSLDVRQGNLGTIPRTGPLIVVANHPFGILDGLLMCQLLSQVRGDFRVLAHRVFTAAVDVQENILPIDFDETPKALKTNLATRTAAIQYLNTGGAIGIFPAGTVSTAAKPFSQPLDPVWRSFTAKMIAKTNATVVPVYFHGHNSRLFQVASHTHYTLRMGLMIREFKKKVDKPVSVSIGAPLAEVDLETFKSDSAGLMRFLRRKTYDLSPDPAITAGFGLEFEARYKRKSKFA